MRLVIVSPKIPYPAYRDGQSLILFHILKYLARQHDITLLTLTRGDEHQAEEALRAIGVTVVTVAKPKRTIAQYYFGPAWRGEAWFGWKYMSDALIRQVKVFDADNTVDGIVIHSPFLAPLLQYITQKPVVLNAIDELGAWFRQASAHSWIPKAFHLTLEARRAIHVEQLWYAKAKAITVVAERDKKNILANVSNLSIRVIPNGVDIERFQPTKEKEVHPTLAFSGLMDYPPNVEAVLWFAQYVWPTLSKQEPQLIWKIIGAHPAPEIQALVHHDKRIQVTGFVEDLPAQLAKVHLAIVPVHTAAGFQNKILEALACGVPVVGSAQAVAGLPEILQRSVQIASQPGEWVEEIMDVLHSHTPSSEAARKAAEVYSWASVANEYEDLFIKAFQV